MANEIDICNIALSRAGAGSIESLTEKTREARACKLHLDLARDSALRDHDWEFARKQASLALLTETVEGWSYVYAYPADCIAAREIFNSAKVGEEDRVPFEVGMSSTGNTRVILTNQASAALIYTSKVTNPVLFDPIFSDALAWRLAAELAVPLRGETSLQQAFMRTALGVINSAKAVGANERHHTPAGNGSLVASRS